MASDFLSKDVVYVNSRSRLSGNSNNFSIDLTGQIRTPNNYDTATLLSFYCPQSYYLIDSSNNSFNVNEFGTITVIDLPIGNYNINSLVVQLNASLASATYTYVASFNSKLGTITFNVSNNAHQPSFDFTVDNLYEILGFTSAVYTFVANVLTSPNVVNLQLANTIELLTDIVRNNVLSVVIPNTANFSAIQYNEQNASLASHQLVRSNITSANFWLLNGNTGLPLNLNGLDFNFTFVVYKANDYYKNGLDFFKMQKYIDKVNNDG